jgi:hypothetical protein
MIGADRRAASADARLAAKSQRRRIPGCETAMSRLDAPATEEVVTETRAVLDGIGAQSASPRTRPSSRS